MNFKSLIGRSESSAGLFNLTNNLFNYHQNIQYLQLKKPAKREYHRLEKNRLKNTSFVWLPFTFHLY